LVNEENLGPLDLREGITGLPADPEVETQGQEGGLSPVQVDLQKVRFLSTEAIQHAPRVLPAGEEHENARNFEIGPVSGSKARCVTVTDRSNPRA